MREESLLSRNDTVDHLLQRNAALIRKLDGMLTAVAILLKSARLYCHEKIVREKLLHCTAYP